MKRLKPLIVFGSLGFCFALGCAHKTTPEEIRAKNQQIADSGRDKFYEELVQRNVSWYVPAGQSPSGFNAESGLPEQPVPADATYVKAHNDAIAEYTRKYGPVPGSFLPWKDDLFHQPIYWSAHGQQPDMLRTGGSITSPDSGYTLTLQRTGTAGGAQSGFQIAVQSPVGQRFAPPPAGATEPSAEVVFGPSGSDLAFTRWPSGGQDGVYAAMSLRDGRWLVVQKGQK